MRVDLTPFLALRDDALEEEREYRWKVPSGVVEGVGRALTVEAASEVALYLRGDRRQVLAQVEAHLPVACWCDRCLGPVRLSVDVHYAEIWRLPLQGPRPPRGRRGDGVLEGPWAEDPAREEGAEGAVLISDIADPTAVDISDGFWQNLAFALPTKVLCRPDCRGLCPVCGADLNRGPCRCDRKAVDPRWAALAVWQARRG